jgi:signal recognition particle receptor subunit beta
MVLFNYATRELTAKIVYYGPGLCGKTTNLQFIHQNLPEDVKGKMLSLATKTDRTLFFDFLPIDLGEIRGMKTRVQLYTVPGQVFYNETRKLVLKGADGIVFVADSQEQMVQANVESFKNLEENLKAHGMSLAEMPHVIQFNKRDLPNLAGIEELNTAINKYNAPFYESVATTGIGVQDTLKAIAKLVLLNLTRKYDPKAAPADAPTAPPVAPAASPAAPAAAGGGIPLSSVETPGMAAAPPPSASVAPTPSRPPAPPQFHAAETDDDSVPEFGESEIDQLVDEVDEAEGIPAAALDGVPSIPPAPEPAAGDAQTMAISAADIRDLNLDGPEAPAAEPTPPVSAPAPEAIGATPGGGAGYELEVDLDFDPDRQQRDDDEIPLAAAPEEEAPPSFEAPEPAGVDGGGLQLAVPPEPESTRIPVEEAPPEMADAGVPADIGAADATVLLTEAASDDELFNDPSLEVARLTEGEAREIVVPVLLGEGAQAKRFKLSVLLRVDPVD